MDALENFYGNETLGLILDSVGLNADLRRMSKELVPEVGLEPT